MKQENRRSLPLFWRLLAIIMVCWFALLSVTLAVTLRYSLRTLREQIDSILMSTVVTLGNNPNVRQAVEQGCIEPGLADYLTDVVVNTECLEFITIADRDSIRIYHIDPGFIGLPFEGGDEDRALAGECYISDAATRNFQGQHRAFHPIRSEGGEVIGFVMASATFDRIDQLRSDIYSTYLQLFLLLMSIALVTCAALAMYLGRSLRGVKPEDLLRVYLTQNDILNGLDEGLVSFDNTGRVRLVNSAAAKILGHREELLLGLQMDDLLRAEDGSSLRNRDEHALQSNRPNIVVRPVQLPNADLWARQVLILADKSEVTRYAEELGGTRHMLSTLRANTHEFLNKLQVISGLLQMGRTEEALGYIGSIAAVHEHITGPVMKLIRNTGLAALILGKASNMRELDIDFILLSNSGLPDQSAYLSGTELVTVVGNLLENAIEATNVIPAGELRAVTLQITEDEKGLLIMVSDTGEGIGENVLPHIFEPGFSTKAQKGRGVGMRRIKEIVDSHGGTIDVDTEPGSGTTFTIIFSQKRGGRV
ncbi:MAG: sensor histidine kinase [Oscillospiraceae bacterium]|nr:sensor histidine kinase [Oscillospiraceae bacterium]